MTNTDQNIALDAVTSDESFTTPTSVEEPRTNASGSATLEGMTPEELERSVEAVRGVYREYKVEEREAQDSFEVRHARLLATGFNNARDLLANKSVLYRMLAAKSITVGKDDDALLGGIAKLQLGYLKVTKAGEVWTADRKDERLARFYRIFLAHPDKFANGSLEATILAHNGKTGGILKEHTFKPKAASPKEKFANLAKAKSAKPIVQVKDPKAKGKAAVGSFRLLIVRATSEGFDVCTAVEDEKLTERLVDKWAADVALKLPSAS